MYLAKKVIKMFRKEDLKISFQYVTMQITLGNIPDGEKKTNKQNGCLFQCEQTTFSKGGTEGSKRKRKDTEIAAKNERDPRCSIAFPKLVFLLQNARELLKDVGCHTLKHLQM